MDIRAQKDQARRSVAERMQRLSEKDRQAESRSICRRIKENLPEEPLTICAYYPMKSEADIIPLLEELLERGCTIALPRTEGRSFEFRIVPSFDALRPGPFRILEPTGDMEVVDIADVQYVFVPGVAFDPNGGRLGRGNGGYDQWITRLRSKNDVAEAWGIALECQMLNIIPAEPHDERMDALVTQRGFSRPNPQPMK